MPTNNPRITFTLTDEMRERIDTYRFDNRMKNQTQAILSLIDIGLKELNGTPAQKEEFELTKEDMHVLSVYHRANPIYQSVALEMLETHPAEKKASLA